MTLARSLRSALVRFKWAVYFARADRSGIVKKVRGDNLTYLSNGKLAKIIDATRRLDADAVPGSFVEAGCALGGSTIVIAEKMAQTRRLNTYDVFGMIPPPTEEDPPKVHDRFATITGGAARGLGGDEYYGYQKDLKGVVAGNLQRHLQDAQLARVRLIEGRVQDTLDPDGPVAFAHIDVDWYDPVKHCLTAIWAQLSVGGTIILDDYFDWGGCTRATDEFLQGRDDYRTDRSRGSLEIVRTK